jgi:hypothetical protein
MGVTSKEEFCSPMEMYCLRKSRSRLVHYVVDKDPGLPAHAAGVPESLFYPCQRLSQ